MPKLNVEFRENLIATIRALVSDESIQVEFLEDSSNNFFAWNQNLVKEKRVFVNESRAACDLAACYLLFHDYTLRQAQGDQDVMLSLSRHDQEFFDEFEKIRVLAEVKDIYRGAAQNILAKLEQDFPSDNLSLVLLDEIFSKNFSSEIQKNLNGKIINEIKNLRKKTSNQQAFAQGVAKVLEMLKNEQKAPESKEEAEKENDLESSNQENTEGKEEEKFAPKQEEGEGESKKEPEQSEEKSSEEKGEVSVKLGESEVEEDRIEFKKSYKIYTTKFDEVLFPQKLTNKQELETLRDQLDLRLTKLGGISRKMTLKLKRKLLSKRDLFLEFDSSRGMLDRKKLTRLVTKPLSDDVWVNSKNHEYQDTALTILLDNSGSMRGQPIIMSALACEIIAAAISLPSIM